MDPFYTSVTQLAQPLRVLVAPLDWGLGHATRCIPVIRQLLANGCEVVLACDGKAAALLQSNFPELTMLPLEGYNIRYSKTGAGFIFRVLVQIPKILKAINNERNWLTKIQQIHHFDLVISDNRYGLNINGLNSIIMTHQLQILTGSGAYADKLMLWLHRKVLEKFDTCWIVDKSGEDHLGGKLSHPTKRPRNATYIGLLSQIERTSWSQRTNEHQILILLSGPEPMRSILEEKIMDQISNLTDYHFEVVAGNPAGPKPENIPAHVDYHTHLNAEKLGILLKQCGLVICRSGYSTLMDLSMLGKKALLIPTPGQTEQIYLAKKLQAENHCHSSKQSKLNLAEDIAKALTYPGLCTYADQSEMIDAVSRIIQTISSNRNVRNGYYE